MSSDGLVVRHGEGWQDRRRRHVAQDGHVPDPAFASATIRASPARSSPTRPTISTAAPASGRGERDLAGATHRAGRVADAPARVPDDDDHAPSLPRPPGPVVSQSSGRAPGAAVVPSRSLGARAASGRRRRSSPPPSPLPRAAVIVATIGPRRPLAAAVVAATGPPAPLGVALPPLPPFAPPPDPAPEPSPWSRSVGACLRALRGRGVGRRRRRHGRRGGRRRRRRGRRHRGARGRGRDGSAPRADRRAARAARRHG